MGELTERDLADLDAVVARMEPVGPGNWGGQGRLPVFTETYESLRDLVAEVRRLRREAAALRESLVQADETAARAAKAAREWRERAELEDVPMREREGRREAIRRVLFRADKAAPLSEDEVIDQVEAILWATAPREWDGQGAPPAATLDPAERARLEARIAELERASAPAEEGER